MKHIIWMLALALTAATWSACSNKDELTDTEQPRTFTVTTTLSPKGGAQTRSTMTDVGGATGITAEWELGDEIWVGYFNENGIYSNYVQTTAEVIAVDPSTKAATITLTLTDPKDGGEIDFGYPRSYWEQTKDEHTDQKGTLDDINTNYAGIIGSGEMTVSGTDVTLPDVTMEPWMCIWKFTFTDGVNDITSDITKLIIDFPDILDMTYEVTPTSQSTIYVALFAYVGINAKPMSITAQTATGVYRKTAASVTLAAGTTYTTTGLALKKAEVGKVFGADGNIYDNAAATPGGNTAVAMIAYVGNASNCSHGLAIAMSDVSGTYNWSDAITACSDKNTAAAVTGGTWRLPSIVDWQNMLIGCGAGGTVSDSPSNMSYSQLANKLYLAGGSALAVQCEYWSATEYNTDRAWRLFFIEGNTQFYDDTKTEPSPSILVRACLAF